MHLNRETLININYKVNQFHAISDNQFEFFMLRKCRMHDKRCINTALRLNNGNKKKRCNGNNNGDKKRAQMILRVLHRP